MMGHSFFVDIHASHASKKAMAGLKKSFENGTLFKEYAGKGHSRQSWAPDLFLAMNPREARLMFHARGNEPPAALFKGLEKAGFEFEGNAYPETGYCYSTQEPLDLSDLPLDEVFSLENGSCLAAVLRLEIEE
jgi:hypothetical protein